MRTTRPARSAVALAVVLLLGVGTSGCGGGSEAGDGTVRVRDATVDEPVNGHSAAARFVLDNRDGPDDRLVGAASDAAGSVTIHRSEVDADGATSMVDLVDVDVPAGEEVEFAPGGLHLMLEDLVAPLEPGDLVTLVLSFEEAGEVVVEAGVVPLGATGSDGSGGHHH